MWASPLRAYLVSMALLIAASRPIRTCAESKTGGTGLEPATSGVTGRPGYRDVEDRELRVALSMRFLDLATLTRSGCVAALSPLLPPCAARVDGAVVRRRPLSTIQKSDAVLLGALA